MTAPGMSSIEDAVGQRLPAISTSRGLVVRVAATVAASLVIADQATKELALRTLQPGVFVPFLGDEVGWSLTRNEGGAFSAPIPWWVFPLVTAVVIVLFLRSLPAVSRLAEAAGFGMLLAGAVGNGLDRVFRSGDPGDPRFLHGHVVDFVAWGSWPRFNVADAAITVGFVFLLWSLWRARADH